MMSSLRKYQELLNIHFVDKVIPLFFQGAYVKLNREYDNFMPLYFPVEAQN